jgi:inorganic pyrophosphatase
MLEVRGKDDKIFSDEQCCPSKPKIKQIEQLEKRYNS